MAIVAGPKFIEWRSQLGLTSSCLTWMRTASFSTWTPASDLGVEMEGGGVALAPNSGDYRAGLKMRRRNAAKIAQHVNTAE